MKHCLYIFLFALSILFLASCTNDYVDDIKQGNGKRLCHLSLNAAVSDYSDNVASRATATPIPTSATLYLYFSANGTTIPAVAKYNSSEKIWDLSFEGSLSPNGTCKVYYITDAKSTTETEVQLTSSSAVYGTSSGSYTYTDTKGVSVTATLQPLLSRIRFKGVEGTQIRVSGAKTLDVFKISDASYTTLSTSQPLTVASDGYTPYLYYAQPDGTNPLSIQSDGEDFTIANPLKSEGGYSAYITIPTKQSHYGWVWLGEPTSVDLGLSVKWATFNVGAKSPKDYGDYFAWGETETKSVYNWSTYKDNPSGDGTTFTKYATDKKTVLDPEDDAAHVNWGGSWRMPTKAEQDELHNNCYWQWVTTYNGKSVNGYIVYKVKNSADKGKWTNSGSNSYSPVGSYSVSDPHIFLPAAGCRGSSYLYNVGSGGYYWSSSLYSDGPDRAYALGFFPFSVSWGDYVRNDGQSVRPVCP